MKRREHVFLRLKEEWKAQQKAVFVTLTYSDEHVPVKFAYNQERGAFPVFHFEKSIVQLWMKILRKTQPEPIKYYLVSEYGEKTLRPHYHAIIFNLQGSLEQITLALQKTWKFGLINVGTVTDASINYVAKYMINRYEVPEGFEKPFSLSSKGLGLEYVRKCLKWHKNDLSRNYMMSEGGVKHSLPRYYKEKIYSKVDRQKQQIIAEYLQNSKEEETENFNETFERNEIIKKRLKNSKSKF